MYTYPARFSKFILIRVINKYPKYGLIRYTDNILFSIDGPSSSLIWVLCVFINLSHINYLSHVKTTANLPQLRTIEVFWHKSTNEKQTLAFQKILMARISTTDSRHLMPIMQSSFNPVSNVITWYSVFLNLN